MTYDMACKVGQNRIKKGKATELWIIWEPIDDGELPDSGYHLATEIDLDTFFYGCNPIAYIGKDGIER